jgi:hypothetical protein
MKLHQQVPTLSKKGTKIKRTGFRSLVLVNPDLEALLTTTKKGLRQTPTAQVIDVTAWYKMLHTGCKPV